MIHREFAGRRHILVVFIAIDRDTAQLVMLGRDVPTCRDEVPTRIPIAFKIRCDVVCRSNPSVRLGPLLLLLLVRPAIAGADVTALSVLTQPTLAVVAEHAGQQILSVAPGAVVQLVVSATYADGSTSDVTAADATTYLSLAPDVATVDVAGRLTFAPTAASDAALVSVDHAGTTRLVSFRLTD